MSGTMRCLSIRQPFSWAICAGLRDVENRTWSTDYRGQIAIHASSKPIEKGRFDGSLDNSQFTRGAIIGVVDLIDVVELTEALESDRWAKGPICWLLRNGVLFDEPIPAKGKMQLYGLAEDVANAVRNRLSLPPRKISSEMTLAAIGAIQPSSLELCLARANSYDQLDNLDAMKRMASEAIRLDQRCGYAFRLRAAAAINNREWQASLQDLDEAIRFDDGDPFAWYFRSIVWEQLGDEAKSNADRMRAFEILPEVADLVEGSGDDFEAGQ